MTRLLQKAFAGAANLPEAEQDELARNLLEDLAAEVRSVWTLLGRRYKLLRPSFKRSFMLDLRDPAG